MRPPLLPPPAPMLARPTSGSYARSAPTIESLLATGDWVADLKLDGIRAMAAWNSQYEVVTLWNRNGVDITPRWPDVAAELATTLNATGATSCMLDGELMTRDGRFSSALIRDKQQADVSAAIREHPATFVAFDLPWQASAPWVDRRLRLSFMAERAKKVGRELLLSTVSEDLDFVELVRDLKMEGVILKYKDSCYSPGVRSHNWLKYKNLHRVTCLVTEYTPGNGHRADFGALELTMLGPTGRPVSVGRVGTGFTETEIVGLKTTLDMNVPLTVEVECLGVTDRGQLRMPVFIDVRLDMPAKFCTLGQLDALPTC